MSDGGSASAFIRRELEKLPADRLVKFTSDNSIAMIRCPNPDHKGGMETKPSLRINILKKDKYWPGSGKCFSCGFRVKNWNELAEWIYGLKKTNEGGSSDDLFPEILFDSAMENRLLGEDDENDSLDIMPWDSNQSWRTVSPKVMKDIGAGIVFNSKLKRMFVYLPVVVNKKTVGYIQANIVKKGKLNYFNSDGQWTHNFGLFLYDYVKKFIKKHKLKSVVLVEGPRDALKCIQWGIPAVAVLGASNWSDMKTELILALQDIGVKRVITAFDPDDAGLQLTAAVYASLKDEIDIKRFKFPDKKIKDKETGKMVTPDPGNAPKSIMLKLKHACTREIT